MLYLTFFQYLLTSLHLMYYAILLYTLHFTLLHFTYSICFVFVWFVRVLFDFIRCMIVIGFLVCFIFISPNCFKFVCPLFPPLLYSVLFNSPFIGFQFAWKTSVQWRVFPYFSFCLLGIRVRVEWIKNMLFSFTLHLYSSCFASFSTSFCFVYIEGEMEENWLSVSYSHSINNKRSYSV